MLPILVIFLLVQSLSATNEFPDLMENVKVSWNGVDITSQLDANLTSSRDNQVEYFLLCGPYQTLGTGGYCKVESHYEIYYSKTNITRITSFWGTDVRHIGPYSSTHNSSVTCIAFPNLIPNFMEHKQQTWYGNFTCQTAKPIPKPVPKPDQKPESESDSKPMGVYVVGTVIVMAAIGFFAFKIGQKKGAESSQGNSSGAYKTLGANSRIHGGNPSYGNPFAQTA